MTEGKALIIVDAQNDFVHTKGALCAPNGASKLPAINELVKGGGCFDLVIKTRDWHPANHQSFTMWPSHGVENSWGAAFHDELATHPMEVILSKGRAERSVGYSAFGDDVSGVGEETSALAALLKRQGVGKSLKIQFPLPGSPERALSSFEADSREKLSSDLQMRFIFADS